MYFKRKILAVIGIMSMVALWAYGKNLSKNEIYNLAGKFSDAVYSDSLDLKNELKQEGWDITYRTFKKTKDEIDNEIVRNSPELQSFLMAEDFMSTDKKIENLKRFVTETKIYELHPNSIENYIDLLTGPELKYLLSSYPEQHFGYLVASKKINGENIYVIAYEGTHGLNDMTHWWNTNLRIRPIKFLGSHNAHVHAGFEWYRQACWADDKVISNLIDKIKQDKSDYTLIITGHSMGGSAAVLQTAHLIEKDILPSDKIHLVTLAEPCPGRLDFLIRFHHKIKNYIAFINFGDPVPVLPEIVGYRHFYTKVDPFNRGNYNPIDRHDRKLYRKYIAEYYK